MPETPNTLDELLAQSAGDGGSNGGGLRAVLEATLAELKAVKAENAQFAQARQATERTALFAKHGIPELAQKLFPKDSPLTDEAATAFVTEFGALWGGQGETAPAATPAAPATTPVADQQAAALIQQLSSTAAQPTLQPRSEQEYRELFAQAKTPTELSTLLEQASLDMQGLGL
jgi:hypothetical protein